MEPDRPQRIDRLTPLADVLARLDAMVEPVAPRSAALSAAQGRTLAEDVVVASPIPPAARALRDGWAVSSDLTIDASGYAPAPLPFALRLDVRAKKQRVAAVIHSERAIHDVFAAVAG